ncbi:MAG: hypothetical protein KDJ73_00460 [Notoacmeibacter sp.]|nr:hypothetical protein [Notoacmeibacter sp.]
MRIYLIIMAILAVLSVIFAIPDLGMMLIFLTIGLALPFMFVATLLYYGACLFPAVALWKSDRNLGLALTVLLFGAAAWLPGFQAARGMKAIEASLMTGEKIPSGPVSATTVELRTRTGDAVGTGTGPCTRECRALMLENGVARVRLVEEDRSGKKPPAVTVYRRASGSACDVPGFEADGKACVLPATDNGQPAQLTLSFEPLSVREAAGKLPKSPARLKSARLVTATLRNGADALEIYRHTEITTNMPMRPAVLTSFKTGMNTGGVSYMRSNATREPVTLASLLTQLGYTIPAVEVSKLPKPKLKRWEKTPQQLPDADLVRSVHALLDLPGATPFTRNQAQPITRWTMLARRTKDWNPDNVTLMRRIIAEKRLTGIPLYADQILTGNRDLARQLLPDVLDRLEAVPHGSTGYEPVHPVGYNLDRLDPQLLKAYQQRIVALAKRTDRTGDSVLKAALSFGTDPREFVPALDWTEPMRDVRRRITAMCHADDKWSPVILSMVRRAFGTLPDMHKPGGHHSYRLGLIKLLARHGALEEALRMVKPDDDRMRRDLTNAADTTRDRSRRCQF